MDDRQTSALARRLRLRDESLRDLESRLKGWLRDIAYPGPNKAKRLAQDFDTSKSTAALWLTGRMPVGLAFNAMVHRWGTDFLDHLYPDLGILRQSGRELIDRMGEVRAGVDQLQKLIGRSRRLLPCWISDDGSLFEAAAGHTDFVRRFLQLPASMGDSLVGYATENWGWIAISYDPGSAMTAELCEERVTTPALERLRALILDAWSHGAVVLQSSTDRGFAGLALSGTQAVAELELELSRRLGSSQSGQSWMVERLPLDSVEADSTIAALLRINADAVLRGGSPVGPAFSSKLLESGTLLSVGADITAHYVGTGLQIDPSPYIGRSIRDMNDPPYSALVTSLTHRQLVTPEPMLHQIRAVRDGKNVSYRRLSLVARRDRDSTIIMTLSDNITVS